jgi:hypoxanthine phosphoribosyltransferase
LDSGYTLNFVTTLLRSQEPKSLRVVALLDKPSRRLVPFVADYVGFKIEDNFVVGYGMDWNEKYRELPEIYVFAQGIAAGEI